MRFDKLDLNLLVAFDALMEERSVSGSALRLNLSQSAMSGALARLRQYFGDELLVSVGRTMVPTQMGLELTSHVRQALTLIRTTITTPNAFDPHSAERCFNIIASDYVYDVMLCDVLKEISGVAPGISFRLGMPAIGTQDKFARGEIDLFITVEEFLLEDCPRRFLFGDELAVISWSGNDALPAKLTMAEFERLPHVDVTFGENMKRSFSERALEALEIQRRIDVQVQTFSAVPAAIVGTGRIATMYTRHAHYFARFFPLRVDPMPRQLPGLREAMQWHWMRKNDQGLHWLKERIRIAADALENDAIHGADR